MTKTNTQPAIETTALVQQAEAFALSEELAIRLQEVETSVTKLAEGKPKLVIRSAIVEGEARRLFNLYKEYLKQIDEEREAAKAPILNAGRTIDARAKVHSAAAQAAKDLLERSLREWTEFQDANARAEQNRLNEEHRKRVEAENEKARKKGVEPRQVTPPPVVQTPAKSVTIATGDGGAKTQTWVDNWKWRLNGVPDPSALTADRAADYGIPLRFFRLHCSTIDSLTKATKSSIVIEGSLIEGYNDRYLK